MSKRIIRKIAVLGSGIMGSGIACHFANIGVRVLLLDVAPNELTEEEKARGLTLESPQVRNRIVNESLQRAIKSSPAPLYKTSFSTRITTGNFDDDMAKIAECDWVIEVVVENPDIKRKVFEHVEKYRRPGTLITSNTSGIPIHMMAEGRSEDFRKHFCGTHFFNPPRYLKLLEIIPTKETAPEVVEFLMHYGDLFLGKTTVLCKDTPAFIANRIGIFGIMDMLRIVEEEGLTVEETDKLTGPVLGRPKSATFRTIDVVGLDTLIKVAEGLYKTLPNDPERDAFRLSGLLTAMNERKLYGDKTRQGFYKKSEKEGRKEILSLNLKTLEYEPQQKVKIGLLEQTKTVENLRERIKILFKSKEKVGDFYRKTFTGLFAYASHRIPEIADHLYQIDDAMRAGFGWELGPFELWDAVGVQEGITTMEALGKKPAVWVEEMLSKGLDSFYKTEKSVKKYYDIALGSCQPIPGTEGIIILDTLRDDRKVWGNYGATITDIGDGILNLEVHTKMNTLGSEVMEGINKAIDLAEKDFRGLVIGNEGANFSAGANLGLVFMYAAEQEFDEVDMMVRVFQNTIMRIRYSAVPVVAAPHGLTLGGGCELTMHADRAQAAAETYTGLVEFGVGVIPAGGGTKELTLRVSDALENGDVELNAFQNAFMNIAMAKVSTSAYEAFDMNILRRGDGVSVNKNRLLSDAKAEAVRLAEAGYVMPVPRKDIKVEGKSGLALFRAGIHGMLAARRISEHDAKIADKLAYVMCGGDLSAPQKVSEQYLLDLEREAFVSLTGEKKTLERIQSVLTTGKPLRN